MKATQDQIKFWKSMHEYGDFGKIEKMSGINRRTISLTYHTGKGLSETITAINAFYVERKRKLLDARKAIKAL